MLSTDTMTLLNTDGSQTSSAACSSYLNPLTYPTQATKASCSNNVDWNRQTASSEFEDADSTEELSGASQADSLSYSEVHFSSSQNRKGQEYTTGCSGSLAHLHAGGSLDSGIFRLYGQYPNQVPLQNLMFGKSQQKDNEASQAAGINFLASCIWF